MVDLFTILFLAAEAGSGAAERGADLPTDKAWPVILCMLGWARSLRSGIIVTIGIGLILQASAETMLALTIVALPFGFLLSGVFLFAHAIADEYGEWSLTALILSATFIRNPDLAAWAWIAATVVGSVLIWYGNCEEDDEDEDGETFPNLLSWKEKRRLKRELNRDEHDGPVIRDQ